MSSNSKVLFDFSHDRDSLLPMPKDKEIKTNEECVSSKPACLEWTVCLACGDRQISEAATLLLNKELFTCLFKIQ